MAEAVSVVLCDSGLRLDCGWVVVRRQAAGSVDRVFRPDDLLDDIGIPRGWRPFDKLFIRPASVKTVVVLSKTGSVSRTWSASRPPGLLLLVLAQLSRPMTADQVSSHSSTA